MKKIALFGAGKIGEAIAGLLGTSGRYLVKVCDISAERSKHVAQMWPNTEAHKLDLTDHASTKKILAECDAVLSALPYQCNLTTAKLAIETNTAYFDLTEDVETTKHVLALGEKASVPVMPQCGLAPGFISVAASYLVKAFDAVDTVKMRVGALPIYPSNRLKYCLTWSTEGLINEYGNLCEAVVGGEKRMILPLEGLERFSLDGDEYEAFNTSGGLGTFCDTLLGKVRNLDYKSIRYPGHREFIALLMKDLRFNEDRDTLRSVFERSIPATAQDKCLILVEVSGQIRGRLVQKTYASTVYNVTIQNHHFGAIQITTASGICTPMDLVLSGKLGKRSGVVKAEEIPLDLYLDNEFGKYYKDEKALRGISSP